ncbi:MAG: hypothetical protein H6835_09025 [Planctomycetes bacterium]|nr:hypothetical protein [Planctomycetota bacterium]
MNLRPSSASWLALLFGACASSAPSPDQLGPRIRCRIVARGPVDSITSAEHRVFLLLVAADGTRRAVRLFSPAYAESEGICGELGVDGEILFEREGAENHESVAGEPTKVHDVVIADDIGLCFAPGSFYVYRRVEGTKRFAADPDPEIRFGQVRRDGSGYVELTPSLGPEIGYDDDPPGWPPAK